MRALVLPHGDKKPTFGQDVFLGEIFVQYRIGEFIFGSGDFDVVQV